MVEEGYSNRQIEEISGAGTTAVIRWKNWSDAVCIPIVRRWERDKK